MPILAKEPSVYPGNLFTEIAPADADRQWWAVYTKPRQEKSLARDLVQKDIPFFLPLISRFTLVNGRKKQSYLPLFGSYLFLFGTEEERGSAFATDRIVQTLDVDARQEMTADLLNIHRLIEEGAPLAVESRLAPGQRVRVKNGALMGVEGEIVSRRGEDRLVIAVRFLQQGVSVVIQDYQVEPI
ncbi:transcription termination/antitermination protein NusG [Anatilimnocola sp. NA78]|uniref:transcription termination/antitermination protein NusG n=1 Tax=Anatilimnocola sp. NA78 TaxID=3415683 RepID=UPI003CE4FB34